jgi:unsaturated rhamnogalacturonyl hydrolase
MVFGGKQSVGLLILLASASAQADPSLVSPARGAVVLGSTLVAEVRGCEPGAGSLDATPVAPSWASTPYPRTFVARIPLPGPGMHHLRLRTRCGRVAASFDSRFQGTLELGRRLEARYLGSHPPDTLSWGWGSALLLYGAARLGDDAPVHAFVRAWLSKGIPAPDRADTAAPGLAALALARGWPNSDEASDGAAAAVPSADYVRSEPRLGNGGLPHLGHSLLRIFYPDSLWVDSLMMTGVFSAQWGRTAGDSALLDWAAAQPLLYASLLQDPATGLFHHAWLGDSGHVLPGDATYWLRGNGWVLVSIMEILHELDPASPSRAPLLALFSRVAAGLLPLQLDNGLWDELANLPGKTFAETSGSSLVAYALARYAHDGGGGALATDTALAAARRAFAGVTSRMRATRGGFLSLPGVSGPTNPGPRFFYELVPAETDVDYGIGAYLLASSELDPEVFP